MNYLKYISITIILFSVAHNSSFAQTADTQPTNTTTESIKTIMVKVKGVGCARDLQAISNNVVKLNGVSICESVKKGATTTFSVTYAPSVVNQKAIHDAVEATPGCDNQSARPYKVKTKN
ncbi:MAG: hypothetical protein AAF960_29730 [Bacteroidota bacterium]